MVAIHLICMPNWAILQWASPYVSASRRDKQIFTTLVHHNEWRSRHITAGQMLWGAFTGIAQTGYAPALSRNFLDPEIVQRVLKVSDSVVLFAGTTALFMQSAIALDPQAATMMTFATMVMVFATLLVLRWLGAYHIRSLLQPARSTVTLLTPRASTRRC
jgi:hypothetical protein